MKSSDLVCIICPNGCELQLQYSETGIDSCTGALCQRGLEYARQELFQPVRTLTTSVAVSGGDLPLVSVRTNQPIPKALIAELMQALSHIRLEAPVATGQVVLEEPLGLPCKVICTKPIAKMVK